MSVTRPCPRRVALHFVLLSALISATVVAYAQTNLRVRGTITAFDGNVLSVKTREGKDLQLRLGEKTVVVAAKPLKLEELKPGEYVFTTAQVAADGTMSVQRITVSRDGVKPPQ